MNPGVLLRTCAKPPGQAWTVKARVAMQERWEEGGYLSAARR